VPETSGQAGPEIEHGDPRQHAAELLEQADRLTDLARELRTEAQRLNAALKDPELLRERRFAPSSEETEGAATGLPGESGELPISDGARLMITNLATSGSSRQEILEVMRDELGLKNAEEILEWMRI
jgi:hypothetical protein